MLGAVHRQFCSCEQNTLRRNIFSYLHACLTVSHVTLAQGVVRVMSSMSHALVCLTSLRLSILHCLSHLLLHSLNLHLHLPCGSVRSEVPCALPRMRSLNSLVNNALSQFLGRSSNSSDIQVVMLLERRTSTVFCLLASRVTSLSSFSPSTTPVIVTSLIDVVDRTIETGSGMHQTNFQPHVL